MLIADHLCFIYIIYLYLSVVHTALSPNQLEKDEGFKEFLSVHQKRDQAPTWANDVVQAPGPETEQAKAQKKKKTTTASDDYLNFDSDDSEAEDDDDDEEVKEEEDDLEDEGRSWVTDL